MNRAWMRTAIAASVFVAGAVTAVAADPIEGTWKRPASKGGTLEVIAQCGNAFCVTVGSGEFKGKQAGSFTKQPDGSYKGKLTEMKSGISFSGSGTVSGNVFTMKALGGMVKEDWVRQ